MHFLQYWVIAVVPALAVWTVLRRPGGPRILTVCGVCLYVGLLISVTLFPTPIDPNEIAFRRSTAIDHLAHDLRPLATITEMIRAQDGVAVTRVMLGNVILFVPLGFLLPFLSKSLTSFWAVLATGAIASTTIEAAQFGLSTMLGFVHRTATVDDVLLNSLGACVGWLAYRGANAIPAAREAFAPFHSGYRLGGKPARTDQSAAEP